MSLEVQDNLREVIAKLRRKAGEMVVDVNASITNNVEYAAAVDQGYERMIVWTETTRAQRYAIIQAMKKRKGAPKLEGKGLTVERGEGWVKVAVPGAAMVARSIKPAKAVGKQILKRLPPGFGQRHLNGAVAEIAFATQAILVDNTPVDQGALIKGWEVNL